MFGPLLQLRVPFAVRRCRAVVAILRDDATALDGFLKTLRLRLSRLRASQGVICLAAAVCRCQACCPNDKTRAAAENIRAKLLPTEDKQLDPGAFLLNLCACAGHDDVRLLVASVFNP